MSIVPHRHFLLDLPIAIFRFVINFQNRGQPTRGAEKKKRRNVSVLHARVRGGSERSNRAALPVTKLLVETWSADFLLESRHDFTRRAFAFFSLFVVSKKTTRGRDAGILIKSRRRLPFRAFQRFYSRFLVPE